jgi:hypothetical protein
MESRQIAKFAVGSVVTLTAVFLLGVFGSSPRVQAQNAPGDYEASLIAKGFEIAPVHLNLAGKDPNLVGLGSYLVNAVGDCNGCHSSGAPPLGIYPFVTGKNPYFNQPEKVDPMVYLNGGANFGAVGTATGPNGYAGPNIKHLKCQPDLANAFLESSADQPSFGVCIGTSALFMYIQSFHSPCSFFRQMST